MADEKKEPVVEEKKRGRARGVRLVVLTALITLLAAVGGVALLVNILQRKQEGQNPFYRVVTLTDETVDPEIWGKNFPQQYDGYLRTVDQVRTRYGGSEAVPRTPTEADPRSIVAQSRLEEDPRLKVMWAGYAFSRDFREERGHAHMLTDQVYTKLPFMEARKNVSHPVTCIDCHDPSTMALRVTRPGFLEGIAALASSED